MQHSFSAQLYPSPRRDIFFHVFSEAFPRKSKSSRQRAPHHYAFAFRRVCRLPVAFQISVILNFGSSLRDITEIPDYRGPGIVRNGVDFIVQTLNHLDHSRSVWVNTIPKAAIEDDLREFFEELDYLVERIFALYRPQHDSLHRQCFVVFQNAAMASSAVDELHGAALFAGKVSLWMLDSEESITWLNLFKSRNKRANWVDLTWGWLASKSPRISDLKLREPPTRPIKDGL
jgi:hypothetical protein